MRYFSVLILVALTTLSAQADQSQALNSARQATNALAGSLKQALVGAMREGGPLAAIDVCHVSAQPITDQVSARHDWRVARTSLAVRNPDNAPDAWEREQLQRFQEKRDGGAAVSSLEVLEQKQRGGETVQRYMKAIPVQAPCLACHGSELSEDVTQALDTRYPDDTARGYQLGDLRGAFTLERRVPRKSNGAGK